MAQPVPVNVFIPPAPIDADSPIFVDANDAVVTSLPWLDWVPAGVVGGIQRASLKHSEALAAFCLKCKVDRSPAAMVALQPVNILTLRLVGAAWSRILTAVRDNGLANRTVRVLEELHAYVKGNVPAVIVGPTDWQPAPALALAAGNAAARAASARIRFLGLANLATLEVQQGALASAAPWTAICKLAGAIGGVHTQAARVVETSYVQSAAETIRTHSTGGATDASLAANLRSNILRATLPKVLRAHGASPDEQNEALVDGFSYMLNASDRKAVEQKRIDLVAHW